MPADRRPPGNEYLGGEGRCSRSKIARSKSANDVQCDAHGWSLAGRSASSNILNEVASAEILLSPHIRGQDQAAMPTYCAVIPPSITSSDPVTQDDSSDARNST